MQRGVFVRVSAGLYNYMTVITAFEATREL